MRRTAVRWGLVLAAGLALGSPAARGQGPTVESVEPEQPGGGEGSMNLFPTPGSGGSLINGGQPSGGLLPGRPGPSAPRVPTTITQPGGPTIGAPPSRGVGAPPELPIASVPLYGPLSIPSGEDEGPQTGLTLDQAIERLVHENLDLRARFYEIPKAQADILTASLRANPLVYADVQLVPYGQFTAARPGGQTQYDVNITHPLDVTQKRKARMAVASQAQRVVEAQYQDAVRLQIDNLYTAYVDVLSARELLRYYTASVTGLGRIAEVTQEMMNKGLRTQADVNRVLINRNAAQIGQVDTEETLRRNKRTLAALLNLPPEEAEALEPRGTIYDTASPPPPTDELVRLALMARPDLAALRLNIGRALADVRLARANRLSDLYLLYQPYTFQSNAPFGLKSPTSWALGMTVPLPVYDRNQGRIRMAELNVAQAQTALAAQERQIATEVRQAEREYTLTRVAVNRVSGDLLPQARQVRNDTYRLFTGGEVDIVVYLTAQREYNEVVRQYRDVVVRHRRSMLGLNTAVGQRILP